MHTTNPSHNVAFSHSAVLALLALAGCAAVVIAVLLYRRLMQRDEVIGSAQLEAIDNGDGWKLALLGAGRGLRWIAFWTVAVIIGAELVWITASMIG